MDSLIQYLLTFGLREVPCRCLARIPGHEPGRRRDVLFLSGCRGSLNRAIILISDITIVGRKTMRRKLRWHEVANLSQQRSGKLKFTAAQVNQLSEQLAGHITLPQDPAYPVGRTTSA